VASGPASSSARLLRPTSLRTFECLDGSATATEQGRPSGRRSSL
jgi:hypothetical protein